MKILKNVRDGNKVTLEIEESAEEFQKSVEITIKEAAEDMKLPGFRKGKAPKEMIEKNLNQKAIDDHSAQQLIGQLYAQIIKEAKIDPVGYPKINIKKLARGNPFVFSLELEVYPEVKLGKYKGISVEKKGTKVTEDDVIKVIGDLQNRMAKWSDVTDRAAKEQDVVDLEVEANSDGTEIKSWPRDMQYYPVGSKYISSDFDKELVGLGLNTEKEFSIKFAKDYQVKEVADKEVKFKVKVKKIQEKELVALDDAFAKQVSKFGTLAELKAELTKNLEEEKKQASEADLKNKLVEEASKETNLDIPQAMVDTEIQIMLDEMKGSLARSNLTLENYLKSIGKTEEDMISEFINPANQRVKGKIILKAIAEIENIEATDDDINEELTPYAAQEKKTADELRKSLSEGQIDFLKESILRRKALDFLVEHAKIKDSKEEKV